ncbi:hypothetical protein [Streptomyces sp. NPDC059063]|uniref:hypothetical protein n=1 Tax=unclassified Streptomyces TaxID=2593676 RepID=UPI0036ABE43B
MSSCPLAPRAHVPRPAPSHRPPTRARTRPVCALAWAVLAVLILMSAQCVGELTHVTAPPTGGVAGTPRSLSSPDDHRTAQALDLTEAPGGCSVTDSPGAGTTPTSARALPHATPTAVPALPAGRPVDTLPTGAARGRIPDVGRTVPEALCRWLI